MESHADENNRPVVAAFAPSGGDSAKAARRRQAKPQNWQNNDSLAGQEHPRGH